MAPPRGGLKGLYRQRKKKAKPAPKKKASKDDTQAQQQATDEYGAEEEALRQFDMDASYGPCIGVTRLRRWERAAAMGLSPPPHVRELILRHQHGGDGPSSVVPPKEIKNSDDCLWAGKV